MLIDFGLLMSASRVAAGPPAKFCFCPMSFRLMLPSADEAVSPIAGCTSGRSLAEVLASVAADFAPFPLAVAVRCVFATAGFLLAMLSAWTPIVMPNSTNIIPKKRFIILFSYSEIFWSSHSDQSVSAK